MAHIHGFSSLEMPAVLHQFLRSVEDVMRNWKTACDASRCNAASIPDLDAPAVHAWDGERVTLRWITVHLIREYARHTGHADLLRERIDGATGE